MSQEPPTNSVITTNNNIIISPQQSQIQNLTAGTNTTTIPISSVGVVGSTGTTTIINPLTTSTARVVVSGGTGIGGNVKTNNMQVVKSQDVRVDNWGNYCLQRLQVMYDRGDFCDLILQFHTNQILKVHRVVVNLCTEYFANLERTYGLTGGMLVLPKDIEYSTMVTIVKFFYTGKLEVKGAQFNDIYRTVKLMNILILTKLLEAHARKPIALAKKEPNRPIVFKQAVEIGRPLQKVPVQHTHGAVQQGSTIRLSSPNSTVTTKTLTRPFPPGVKTKTVLARVQPQTIRVTGQQMQGKLSAPKKLPIWKERKFAPAANSDPLMMEKWPPRDEPPRPTRFEWPDPDDHDDPYVTPATHALMDRQKAAASNRKVEDIFDAVKNQSHGVKRSLPTYNTQSGTTSKGAVGIGDTTSQRTIIKNSDSDGSPASKVAKVLDDVNQVEVPSVAEGSLISVSLNSTDMPVTSAESSSMSMSDVNLTDETVEEVVSTSEGSFNQDSLDSTQLSDSTAATETLLTTSIDFESPSISRNQISHPSTSRNIANMNLTAKRSSIKVTTSNLNLSSAGLHKIEKTVRFAPEIEKENKGKGLVVVSIGGISTGVNTVTTTANSPIVVSRNPESAGSSNHSKIISEVLKKYPDLVKDNKNIKLKIVQKESDLPSSTSPTKDSKSKISYIVLKSTSAPDGGGSVVLKRPSTTNRSFWDSDKTPKKLPSGAENTTGPWLCSSCGTEEMPIEFDTYYNYRRHLVDIHGERIDARICEYCGQKASKRNLLLYHLYTKHGVTPPKNCVFPHCDRCDYVALSESLLTKHKQGHDVNKEYSCTICNASFKSNAALQGHMAANLHRNKDTKVYECPYCRKPFVRNINLKAHIRSLHKDVARLEEMEDPRLPPDDSLSSRAVTIVHSGGVKKRQFPSILGAARLQSGATIIENAEDISTSHGMDGIVRSFVTADGQTIEILQGIDPNSMSVPVLVQPSEGTLSLDGQHGHMSVGGTEFVTGMNSDGTQAVFMLDGSQNAVEVDMSQVGVPVGVNMTADGQMIFEGGDPTGGSDQFIVQDMQGNQFRKITGIDETGKQVIFFQLQDENGQVTMAPAILDDSVNVRYDEGQGGGGGGTVSGVAVSGGVANEGSAHFDFESGATFSVQNDHMYLDPQKCSVFVSSGGVTMPVTVASDASMSGQAAQVLLSNLGASVPAGHVIEFHAAASGVSEGHVSHDPNAVTTVTAESLMSQGHVQLVSSDHHHHHLLQGQHQLHIVLDENQVGVVDQTGKTSILQSQQNQVQVQMQNVDHQEQAIVDSQSSHLNVHAEHKLRVINQVIDSVQVQVSEAIKNIVNDAMDEEQAQIQQHVEAEPEQATTSEEEVHQQHQHQQLLQNSSEINLEEELIEQDEVQQQEVIQEAHHQEASDKNDHELQMDPHQLKADSMDGNLNNVGNSNESEAGEPSIIVAGTECETIPHEECGAEENVENGQEGDDEHVVEENQGQIGHVNDHQVEYEVEETECMEIVQETETSNEQIELQECNNETEEMEVVQEEDVLQEGSINTQVNIKMEEVVVVQEVEDQQLYEQDEHTQLLVEEETVVMDPQDVDVHGMIHHEISHVEEQEEIEDSGQVQIVEEAESALSVEAELEEETQLIHDSATEDQNQSEGVVLHIQETDDLLTEEVETQIIHVEESSEHLEEDHEQVIIHESEEQEVEEDNNGVVNLVEISSTDADTQELMVEDAVVDVM